jgi:flagellar basal-body rod protein FlgF
MNVSLYQAAAAMNAQARWQELITENLASGSIPGFRKKEVSFSAVAAGLDPAAINSPESRYAIPAANAHVHFHAGDLRSTGNMMDFALEGPGFFEVKMSNGTRGFTRDGEFHADGRGQLVTKHGHTVMSDNGPLQFDLNEGSVITISPTGEVSQGSELKGRIRISEFNDPASLTAIGDGYFLADKPNAKPNPAINSYIRQGFLEAANVSPTTEMASLITAMRMFEANSRVLQMQDDRMGRVISELGNPS